MDEHANPFQMQQPISVDDVERWLALGSGALLLIAGASKRSFLGGCLAVASAPLLYRGFAGHWPPVGRNRRADAGTKAECGGARGIHVRESIRLETPVSEVYPFWRHLENLPHVMKHLVQVTDLGDGRSHWIAGGPGGISVEWDAELINDIEDTLIAWGSLPGSDVTTAGSVRFDPIRGGRATQVSVHFQYSAPAGRLGSAVAALLGRSPSHTVREDLRQFKQRVEAGEIARATSVV